MLPVTMNGTTPRRNCFCVAIFIFMSSLVIMFAILLHYIREWNNEAKLLIQYQQMTTLELFTRRRYILAANFFNNEALIDSMSEKYLDVIQTLGTANVFVSIVENGIDIIMSALLSKVSYF